MIYYLCTLDYTLHRNKESALYRAKQILLNKYNENNSLEYYVKKIYRETEKDRKIRKINQKLQDIEKDFSLN